MRFLHACHRSFPNRIFDAGWRQDYARWNQICSERTPVPLHRLPLVEAFRNSSQKNHQQQDWNQEFSRL